MPGVFSGTVTEIATGGTFGVRSTRAFGPIVPPRVFVPRIFPMIERTGRFIGLTVGVGAAGRNLDPRIRILLGVTVSVRGGVDSITQKIINSP